MLCTKQTIEVKVVNNLNYENLMRKDDLTTNFIWKIRIDGKPLAKSPIKRSMAKQIQEELTSSMQTEAKLLFTWVMMKHF